MLLFFILLSFAQVEEAPSYYGHWIIWMYNGVEWEPMFSVSKEGIGIGTALPLDGIYFAHERYYSKKVSQPSTYSYRNALEIENYSGPGGVTFNVSSFSINTIYFSLNSSDAGVLDIYAGDPTTDTYSPSRTLYLDLGAKTMQFYDHLTPFENLNLPSGAVDTFDFSGFYYGAVSFPGRDFEHHFGNGGNSNCGGAYTFSDFAEFFPSKESSILFPGDLVGIDLATGLARKYREGDLLLGVIPERPIIIGGWKEDRTFDEMLEDHVLVGLVGQVPINKNMVKVIGRQVYTKDMKWLVGYLLSDNKTILLNVRAIDEMEVKA